MISKYCLLFCTLHYIISLLWFHEVNSKKAKNKISELDYYDEDDNEKEMFNSLDNSIERLEDLDELYNTGLNKFLFIDINTKTINIEYFQLLIEEFLLSNGESSRSYRLNETSLLIIVSKNISLSINSLKGVFKEYIKEAYFKVNYNN
jgi:hypothetical protein